MKDHLVNFFKDGKQVPHLLQAVIFTIYTLVRVITGVPALHAPRELADTAIYLRISSQPIFGPDFLRVDRPFVFPLLLQIVHQNFDAAAVVQLAITILAWGMLALLVSTCFRSVWLRLFSFVVILSLSLVRHLAGWDFVMMTESLSLSAFALLVATGIWLLQGWQIHKMVVLCVIAFLFAFARDTNAYLLVVFAGLLFLGVLFRWVGPKALFVASAFVLIFLTSNLSADTSQRWVFPLVNVIGKRLLPYTESNQYLAACGMPITPELLGLADTFANGQDRSFFNDPALESFRVWVRQYGKLCYVQWLLAEPSKRTAEVFSEFDNLIYFEDVSWYFSRRYSDLLPSRIERALYPVYYLVWLWGGLTVAALVAVIKRAWQENLLWVVFILLCLTIFPHLFITWHGDAMAPHRHAVSVGMQLALAMWLFVFLVLERVGLYFMKEKRA